MSTKSAAVHFNCPHCNALYRLVKTEAGPETKDRQITCRDCGGPLPSRDGLLICKYFLVRKAARPDPRARQVSRRQDPTPKPSETEAVP